MSSGPKPTSEGDGPEAWQPSKPPPPLPDFPEIPDSLRDSARGGKASGPSNLAGIGKGWALALDFVGSILAACLIGYLIDRWQKCSPWGTLGGLGIGFAYAIYRILKQSAADDPKGR